MKLIGFTGRRRSGKDTAALALLDKGYALVKFADPLKAMIKTLLRNTGIEFHALNQFVEGDQKETPLGAICGKSTRFAMQTLGTDWARQMIGDDIWIQIALKKAATLSAVVISDVRFPNEAAAIKRVGGTIIKIMRGQPRNEADVHASETNIDTLESDHIIVNNSTIEALHNKVLSIVEKL